MVPLLRQEEVEIVLSWEHDIPPSYPYTTRPTNLLSQTTIMGVREASMHETVSFAVAGIAPYKHGRIEACQYTRPRPQSCARGPAPTLLSQCGNTLAMPLIRSMDVTS